MKITDFLLALKLQKGVGYVKMLQIASQLDVEEVDPVQLNALDLPLSFREICLRAYRDEKAEETINRIKKQCQVISFFDSEYPEQLRQIYQPPLILFARGNLDLLKKEIVTIVGSRMATDYSYQVINRLMPNLVKQDLVIASGLAKGVDSLAHEAALRNNGKTIAVVGNGLNHYYPLQNHNLQDEIVQKGPDTE